MKKFLLSAAISFLLLFPLAAKNLDFYWDFGTVFAGGNLAFNNPSDGNGKPAAVKLGFNAIALGMAFFRISNFTNTPARNTPFSSKKTFVI